jgi:hypothetical protein
MGGHPAANSLRTHYVTSSSDPAQCVNEKRGFPKKRGRRGTSSAVRNGRYRRRSATAPDLGRLALAADFRMPAVNRVGGYFSVVTVAGVAFLLFSFDGAWVQPTIVLMQKATRQHVNKTLRNMEFPSQEQRSSRKL